MDWSTQPNPFRRYAGARAIRMPMPEEGASPGYDALFRPGGVPPAPLHADSLSRFLYLSLAISAWKEVGEVRWALRCNPSSGNLHPTEGYVVLPAIKGIADAPGLYHYASREHAIEERLSLSPDAWDGLTGGLPAGSFLVGLSSIHWREAWKYGERAFRYCQHDAGHALGALRFAAAEQGWCLRVVESLGDAGVARLLGLDREEDFSDAEREEPDLIAVVWPGNAEAPDSFRIESEQVEAAIAGSWNGKANRLSRHHTVDWEIIDDATAATRKPAGANEEAGCNRVGAAKLASRSHQTRSTAFQIIRQRRSAVAFDGQTAIGAETFYTMLTRVVPALTRVPWDAVDWVPRVHLAMFVHLVNGIPPGLYMLARRAEAVSALREAMKPEFDWTSPPGCPDDLDLYLLQQADCRRAAAQLSLGQDIAGASAFSLGMLAEFEDVLRAQGAWWYRRLFWEGGMVGQVLYLEAEAAGIRSTGIGAYFDDPVHDVLGLAGHRFQSLYHFTVGGPIEDPRLSTLPSYPAPDG